MSQFLSLFKFKRHKKPTALGLSRLHDSNEDILRIIKLYNQGTIKTINDDDTINSKSYPFLLIYRVSSGYIFLTSAIGILTSIYVNCSMSSITPFIVQNQIESNQQEAAFSDDIVQYISLCFYFSGLLGGSLLFGWLGCQVKQRKLFMLLGTLCSVLSMATLVISVEYWMLFPSKFLQGLSNACVWISSTAIIADIWPLNQWGSMIGFIGGLFPLGMTLGTLTVEAIATYVDYHISFFISLGLCILSCLMQSLIIERSSIPEEWFESPPTGLGEEPETVKEQEHYRETRETLNVIEGGSWSKSSSLSTINLRDQPIIFEKQQDFDTNSNNTIQNSIFYHIFTSISIIALVYQSIILASILGTLKTALIENLGDHMNIKNSVYQDIIFSTLLFPFTVSCFLSGLFCDLFGPKMVGLTSVIVSIPALIWVGVPNQNIQSLVSALTLSGITLGGLAVATVVSTLKAIRKVQLQSQVELTKQQQYDYQREQSSTLFGFVYGLVGLGLFSSYLVAKMNNLIGFLWLCFSFAMVLASCIPLMAYFLKNNKKSVGSSANFSGGKGNSKSIVHNTRPKSFAESYLSDDESTLGSARSDHEVVIESKAVIVIP